MGMRSRRSLVAVFASLLLIVGSAWPAAGQATTSTVAGAVRDAQGGVIPGATISLISESRGTTFTASSSETGDFVVPNIPGDTYTVRVEMDGFKTSERKGVSVSPGERAAVGTITIEVGSLEETVTVTGEAPLIQAQTGDRSFVVDTSQVESLPVANRNYASYAAMVPGVVSSMPGSFGIVRADGARTNYLLDGVATVDTGGNQQGLAINSDAIAEVRVISSAYQAEYGRTAGIQIVGVTKSGTNQFRGSVFDIVRKTAWNTNTWVNEKNGNAKPNADQTDWGVTIGGPVGKPGGKNKLFFFFSEQASPRSFGGVITRYRVPTALERRGDFSQSTDNTGALYPYIRDAATGLPCSAADTRGCFQDGGVLGRIPQDRLYGLGLKVLDRWPLPNVSGVNYNLETVQPNIPYNNWLHVARIDYQISDKLRFSAKYAGDFNKVYVYPGTIPGFDDKMTQYGADLLPSATVDYVISPTMVFEGTWGMTQGNERAGQGMMINNSTNKYLNGLGDLPTLYPDARVPVGSYQEKVMKGTNGGVPFYQNGRLALPPQFTWGTRIANPPVNTLYPGFVCWQRTQDVALSVTKLWGPHTFKFGLQTQDSLKVQNVGTQTRGVLPPEGRVNFGNDGNNPLDSGFGFANAALGIFTSYEQQNALIEGTLIYHNRDFYLQDNWRVNPKLTLDYGMRFTHHGPQYDKAGQASNFFPEKWQASQAPLLYQPGCAVAASPCPATSRVAIDPRSGNSLGIGSAGAIGTIVPNTGILMNGIIQQGKGINEANYTESFMSYGPRFGLAYDMKGDQTFVFRGSLGYFFDRVQGDSVFGQSGNPPAGEQSTVYYSTLQSLAAGGQVLHAPPAMLVYYYDAEIGSSLNWNGGVQMVLPWSSSLDVSYVGSHNFNSVSFGAVPNAMSTELSIDLNAPDMGTAYLPQYQDSTRSSAIPGGAAYTTDLLRPYRGIGAVNTTWPRFWTQYDSMQVAYNRRLRNGWSGSFSYTYGLRFEGNTWSPVHLVHNGGTVSIASYQKEKDEVMKNVGRRPHLIKANASWNMPRISGGDSSASKVLAAVANGWQVAAVLTAGNTVPYDATFAYQGISNVNLTGSPNYTARVKVIGDTGSGCSSNQYKQFNPAAFQGPTYYSTGYESGNNILAGCWDKTVDLSLSRNIALGGHRQLQFRMDFFNLFNAVVYNARQTTIQYTTPAAPTTVTNNQYNADGSLNQARLTPANAGAGAATGAQAMRSLQAQLRFYF